MGALAEGCHIFLQHGFASGAWPPSRLDTRHFVRRGMAQIPCPKILEHGQIVKANVSAVRKSVSQKFLASPGLDRRSGTAYVLIDGGPLRPPCLQDLFATRPLDVFETFVAVDPTLLPPKAALRGALMLVHSELGRVLPDGETNEQAQEQEQVRQGSHFHMRLSIHRLSIRTRIALPHEIINTSLDYQENDRTFK